MLEKTRSRATWCNGMRGKKKPQKGGHLLATFRIRSHVKACRGRLASNGGSMSITQRAQAYRGGFGTALGSRAGGGRGGSLGGARLACGCESRGKVFGQTCIDWCPCRTARDKMQGARSRHRGVFDVPWRGAACRSVLGADSPHHATPPSQLVSGYDQLAGLNTGKFCKVLLSISLRRGY